MNNGPQIRLKFWGVRGSIPVPAFDFLEYGGNTTCVELRIDSSVLIIDAGTGIRNLGIELQREIGPKLSVHLLLTHFHWDHIQGLPFFLPLYAGDSEVTFYSSYPEERLRELLEGEMSHPYFPARFELLPSKRAFTHITKGPVKIAGSNVYPFPLHHPQGATGYRIETNGSVITHASDVEHGDPELDIVLREHARNSDILIYDAQLTPEEYADKKGWGHSTWLEATRVAHECNVKRLVLFHHDPGHGDASMREILAQARKHFANTYVAQEGMEIVL